ncbi:MAG TPA: DNA-processing protein DprA [Rhodopila sp.]|uniref:DNA-processing protein DprA n=1 Tax=Rhodopila sp. TaxID=2480087 RepID=UPI002C774CD4|nr:DNA-processing protein DprA [Rhodopila sp.]HVY17409.1 DNA-processing protein DprA [Rhodopila sp.]
MAEPTDRLRLIRTEGVGPVTYRRLMDRFGGAGAALEALPRLARAGGRSRPPAIPTPSEVEDEIAVTTKAGGRMLFLGEPAYPNLLAMMDDAPPCLIVQGRMALAAGCCVAAVGGRNASVNGQRMADMLAADLATRVTVVSGLARGIDTAAHVGAMRTGGTIAVIAGGIDCPYPPENADLHRRIAERHLLVTEAPVGTVPQARHFPRRNRIIAGLSLGVVVVEAAPRSGSLITARIAQEQGREVFAVPGSPLDPRARGGNDLIRQGAILVESAADVLESLPMAPMELREGARPLPPFPAGPEALPSRGATGADPHAAVLSCLSADPTMVDDLLRRCQLSPSVTMAVLLELELAGRVETLPGNRVARLADASI